MAGYTSTDFKQNNSWEINLFSDLRATFTFCLSQVGPLKLGAEWIQQKIISLLVNTQFLRRAERLTTDFWNHRLILGWPQLATADNANEYKQTYDTSVYFMQCRRSEIIAGPRCGRGNARIVGTGELIIICLQH